MQKNLINFVKLWDLEIISSKISSTTKDIIAKVKYKNEYAILKIFSQNEDNMIKYLKYANGNSVIKLLEFNKNAILIEYVNEAQELKILTQNNNDSQATKIFCQILTKLHKIKIAKKKLPHISTLQQNYNRYLQSNNQIIPHNEIENAKIIFDNLIKDQKKDVLIHGDLHHENILYDKKKGWIVIDPKGYIGESEFEFGAYMRNPTNIWEINNPEFIISNRIQIFNEYNFDTERIIKWSYVQAILSAIWYIEDNLSPNNMLNFARIIKQFI